MLMFFPGKPFQPNLVFVPTGGPPHWGSLLALLASIRLGRKGLARLSSLI